MCCTMPVETGDVYQEPGADAAAPATPRDFSGMLCGFDKSIFHVAPSLRLHITFLLLLP